MGIPDGMLPIRGKIEKGFQFVEKQKIVFYSYILAHDLSN